MTTHINKLFGIVILSMYLISCGANELTIDATNQESLKASIKKLENSIKTKEDKETFNKAYMRIGMSLAMKNKDAQLESVLKKELHGLTIKQVIEKANKIKKIGMMEMLPLNLNDKKAEGKSEVIIKFNDSYKSKNFEMKIKEISVNKIGKISDGDWYTDYKGKAHTILYLEINNITDTKLFRFESSIFVGAVSLKDNFNNEYKQVAVSDSAEKHFKTSKEWRPKKKGLLVFLFDEPIKKATKLTFTFDMSQLGEEKKKIKFEAPLKKEDWNTKTLIGKK